MASDSSNSGHQAPDQEIERLAQEIGRLIQRVEPERREDLKELAYTLIREEIFERGQGVRTGEGSPPAPFNPLASGVLILFLGAGLSFIFGPVGLALMLGGLIFILWGAVISWVKRVKG
ncbi:MAG: hypothetical protein A2W66_00050 [Deltaproteobacteria bacterium RIFCSPLOWO2_02_56_12]|nr:MAG: hypothetical protein A2X89_08405 [Deltaproteobacteria bacterium GWD2_55_8]OGQ49105.1 MAG: hypothetical protein A2W66_00050 [Deltaproteobacteria bacterium RIFCSPLOWO2_02_56_12]HBA41253.1 hypothetical protein [Deltaproteobacteria bacterium]